MKPFTLLLTCVGGELSSQVILSLKQSTRYRVRIVGIDSSPHATARHFVDAFHVVPAGTAPNYVDAVRDVVRRETVNLLLPTSDEEALALADDRDAIESLGCQLACTDAKVIRMLSSKSETYAWLDSRGIATPEWHVVHTLKDLTARADAMLAKLGEAVVKPSQTRGGRGAVVIRTDIDGIHPVAGTREIHADPRSFREQLLPVYGEHLPAVVMQRLLEPVHDLDMLAWRGRPLRVIPRRRLDSARPNEGHEIVHRPELIELGRTLIAGLGLSWLYDCDVMYDSAGTPFVVEINPRPSGSVAVTAAAGVPIFEDLIALALGQEVDEIEPPFGRIVVPYRALRAVN